MVTPLKRQTGHGGLIALGVLITTTTVVWMAHTQRAAPPPAEPARPAGAIAPLSERTVEPAPTPPVVDRSIPRSVTATGKVTFDGHNTAHVVVPVAGWLRKPAHGRTFRAGETIGVVYSPEVYLTTAAMIAQIRDYRSQAALEDERTRLYRWGMRREQVARIERTQVPDAALPIIARVSGTVVMEKPLATPFVEPGDQLLTLTDPGSAWLYVEIPAAAAEAAHLGMIAKVTVDGIARPLSAPVTYISRHESEGMRTIRVDLHTTAIKMPPDVNATVELALR